MRLGIRIERIKFQRFFKSSLGSGVSAQLGMDIADHSKRLRHILLDPKRSLRGSQGYFQGALPVPDPTIAIIRGMGQGQSGIGPRKARVPLDGLCVHVCWES